MSRPSRAWSCLLAAPLLCAQADLAPEVLRLARIKVRAAENLEKLPNYTCLETIERSVRRASSRRYELVDLLRLEVALVNRRELFAWPGSREFAEQEISDMVGHGAIGNGSFALHARSIFLSGSPRFTYIGERIRDGQSMIRYDYEVPLIHSGYKMRVRPREGIVGYKGAFWVDADTLDLRRMEIEVTEIPPQLPISAASEVLEYRSVPIGGGSFLLPHASELIIADLQGNESRNRTQFSQCRQFAGESVLTFDEAPGGPAEVKEAPRKIELPADLDVEVELRTTVEGGVTAIGDPVETVVVKDVRRKGELLLPKGAKISGRVVRLERRQSSTQAEWVAGLLLTRFEFGNAYGDFRARLSPPYPGSSPPFDRFGAVRAYVTVREEPLGNPRIGMLNLKGERGKLRAGTRLSWRTQPPSPEEKP